MDEAEQPHCRCRKAERVDHSSHIELEGGKSLGNPGIFGKHTEEETEE